MNIERLEILTNEILRKSSGLISVYGIQECLVLNYVCVFAQNRNDNKLLIQMAHQLGKEIRLTHSGPLFKIPTLKTVIGDLNFLKIHTPDAMKSILGYSDFSFPDYSAAKPNYLSRSGFKLIERKEMEMIELMDPQYDVRVYFSYPSFGNLYSLQV